MGFFVLGGAGDLDADLSLFEGGSGSGSPLELPLDLDLLGMICFYFLPINTVNFEEKNIVLNLPS